MQAGSVPGLFLCGYVCSTSLSIFPKVGLCFSVLFFLFGTTFSGGGVPTRSRASAFTAITARKGLGFLFFRGMILLHIVPQSGGEFPAHSQQHFH